MNVTEYYRLARSLGAFRAVDCIRTARECAELDARANVPTPPQMSWYETLPDGGNRITLSAGILTF